MLGSKNFGQSFRWLADFFWPNESKNERNQTLYQTMLYPISNRMYVRHRRRELGCSHVGCGQGWQGVMSDGSMSDWVFSTSANQSQEALAKAGSQPTFVAVVRVKQHPHEEQSSFGRHRGVYHGATTGITTLIRSLRVLLSSRSDRHHYATSVAPVATHSPLQEYSFSHSVAPVATHSPLRECISPLLHTLRFPFLLRARRPPSLLRAVLASLAFSPSCRPGNCSYLATCQACI